MKNKPYFPMFIDLSDKNIVVVGGGNIATRRVKTLLSFTRNIRVIAPKVTMEMMELGKAGYVELITRPVKRTDFAMAYMVIAATNDRKLNDEIHRICRQEGVTGSSAIFISREFIWKRDWWWESQPVVWTIKKRAG